MQIKEIFIILIIIIIILICCFFIGIYFGYSKHDPNTLNEDEIYNLFDTPSKDNIELSTEEFVLNKSLSSTDENISIQEIEENNSNVDEDVSSIDEDIPTLEKIEERSLSSRIRIYKNNLKLDTPKEYGGKDSKGERLCKEVIVKMFPNTKFYKTRPDWLINPETGASLEFDLYTHNLEGQNVRLAIEYQGEQHRNSDHIFNKTLDHFDKQIKRDNIKINLCKKYNIILLVIWDNKNTYNKIWNEIVEQLVIYDVCPENIDFI